MLRKKSIRDLDVSGKYVLLRVDFNVPLQDGRVTDDTRIRAALPTITDLLNRGARLIGASHLGRPKGEFKEELKLNPVAERLSELLGAKVKKVDAVYGPLVQEALKDLREGEILLLENLRFEKGEEKNDPDLARALAEGMDYYVNDAFGTAHRAHASTSGVTAFLPAVAGLLMEKEIKTLSRCLEEPARPLVAILGGAKVSDKINVMKRFLQLADLLLIGGGMANTFLAAKGFDLKKSFYEIEQVEKAQEIMAYAASCSCALLLPEDLVVTDDLKQGRCVKTVPADAVPDGLMAVDIGPETAALYSSKVATAGTVVWNGPLGVFEIEPFDQGTGTVALAIAKGVSFSIAGGGDLVAALEKLKLASSFSFISTGGGATLEFWEGKSLPGIEALQDL